MSATDTRLFTRAGAFRVDKLGYLKNSANLYLQGWPVDSNGDISTDPSDLSRLRSINIGSVGGTAEPTTRVQINANLRSTQGVSSAAAAQSYKGVEDTTTPSPAKHDVTVGYSRIDANNYAVTIKSGITKITGVATYDATGALDRLRPRQCDQHQRFGDQHRNPDDHHPDQRGRARRALYAEPVGPGPDHQRHRQDEVRSVGQLHGDVRRRRRQSGGREAGFQNEHPGVGLQRRSAQSGNPVPQERTAEPVVRRNRRGAGG